MATTAVARQPNMRNLEGRIDALDDKLDKLSLQVGTLMPRAEIEAADSRRVSVERFEGETNGIRERITRLESGPQKLLGWIALFVSGGIGCLSIIIAGIGTLAAIVIALIPYLAH